MCLGGEPLLLTERTRRPLNRCDSCFYNAVHHRRILPIRRNPDVEGKTVIADRPLNLESLRKGWLYTRRAEISTSSPQSRSGRAGFSVCSSTRTEIYAPFDPADLTRATEAIDLFLGQVARQYDLGIPVQYGLRHCFSWCRLRDSNPRPSDYKS